MQIRKWIVPASSYFFLSREGTPKVEVTVEPPATDYEKIISELRATVEALDDRLDKATDEAREWYLEQITKLTERLEALQAKLETVEANSSNGLEGLVKQADELRNQLADLSTRNSPAPPLETEPVIAVVTPPASPSGDVADPNLQKNSGPKEPAPPNPQKPKRRVI